MRMRAEHNNAIVLSRATKNQTPYTHAHTHANSSQNTKVKQNKAGICAQ